MERTIEAYLESLQNRLLKGEGVNCSYSGLFEFMLLGEPQEDLLYASLPLYDVKIPKEEEPDFSVSLRRFLRDVRTSLRIHKRLYQSEI